MERGRPDNPLEYAPTGQPYRGSAIRQLRQAKKLGLRQLAALIPYNYGALSNVENNRAPVSSEKLQRIAELLSVDAEELERLPVHPRLPQPQAGALEQPPTGDQTRALEALRAEVHALKAAVAGEAALRRQSVEQLQALTVEVSQLRDAVTILKHKIPYPYLALLSTGRNYNADKEEWEVVVGSRQN